MSDKAGINGGSPMRWQLARRIDKALRGEEGKGGKERERETDWKSLDRNVASTGV